MNHLPKSLQELWLEGTSVNNDSLRQLRDLPLLSRLVLSDTNITPAGLHWLQPLKNLHMLQVSWHADDLALWLHEFKQLSHLREISISDSHLTQASLNDLAALRELAVLRLVNVHLPGECEIPNCWTRLSTLVLEGTNVSDRSLENIAELPALRSLDISRAKINCKAVAVLPKTRHLRTVTLSCINIDRDILWQLSGILSLRSVDLNHCSLTDQDVSDLSFPHLTELNLSGNQLSDAGLAFLSRAPRLAVLDLSGTAITDRSIALLSTLHKLRQLNLCNTNLTTKEILQLQRRLPHTTISHLSIN